MSWTRRRGMVRGIIALASAACGGGAPPAVTPGPTTSAAGEPRARLSSTALNRCEVGEVVQGTHTPAALALDPPIGNCWLREGFAAPGSPQAEPELRALPDAPALRALLNCQPDAELESDADASYFTLHHVHYASDTWEVVFSEDDGARVHVGLRIRRACQGIPPQTVRATTLMSLPGRDRALTVHLCERDPRPCPPVP